MNHPCPPPLAYMGGCLFPNQELTPMQTAYLRAAISVRSQQIAALEREVQINRMILSSPIRRLSPELLAHIMVLCISTTRCAPRHALALAHVCRSWRATAFMKADLWTRLSISWAQACHADAIAHTAAWFSRARSRPMSFSIFKYRDFLDFCRPPPSLCPLLKFVLLQHEPQLLELHIALHVLWLPTFLSCARGSLPMLRKLHLDVQYTAHYISKGFYFPLDALPRLQTLHVRGANMLIPSHDPLCNVLLLPCAQLKNLQLDGVMGTHEWGEIFLECTSLVRARISSLKGRDPPQWPSSDGAVPSEVVVFRHLTQSELYYKELPGAVLNVARFPALTTLILGYLPKARHGEMVEDDEATWTVHRGLAQHLKSLTSLTVIGFDFEHPQTEDAFRYILQSLTLLTHLAFESCTLWSLDILSFLTTPDSVPLLEELLFYNMEIKESFLCSQDELELRKDIWDVAIFEETYAFIEKFLRERGLAESSRLRLFQFRLLSFEEDNVEDEFELALRRLVWLAARCLTEKGLEIDLDAIPIDKLDIIPVNSDSESEDKDDGYETETASEQIYGSASSERR